jgi:hypothetical protein
MTSQGTAHGRFQRAIHRRHLLPAEMAARELGGLSLADALDLTLLVREQARNRYERAALRWLERFIQERQPTLSELALAVVALADLRGTGESSLRELVKP